MKAIRIGIGALVVFSVLAFGGVEPWGEAIVEIGAALLLLLWGISVLWQGRVDLRWNWLYLPLFGLCAWALAQKFAGFSANPYATKAELLRWCAYVLLFFLCVQSLRTEKEAGNFIWFLISFSFLVSMFGIVQHFTSNGKLYWFVPLQMGGGPFGPFVNRNHFAGFVELTVPLGLALPLFGACRKEKLPLLGLLVAVPIGALVLAASRGGVLGFLLELVVLACFAAPYTGKKQLAAMAVVAAACAGFVVWLGASGVVTRFTQLKSGQLSTESRLGIDRDTWKIFVRNPWTGTGLGTFDTVYPLYETHYSKYDVGHAHNDYLELLADTGVIGGLCGVSLIGLLFWRGISLFRTKPSRAHYAGPLAACAGLLLHSMVDFNLHIPSNALLFLIVAALATTERTAEIGPRRSRDTDPQ